ncbi:MAG TPA: hypothetical protein VFO10_20100 [Oligoflexus sp.]|uniref:hypothetical protein n=1 Tax=Oligoflexus sp. TaxID=1971216 RepID=UPI002D8035E0|nr:hypothetical protein [Oligoflexus sp.]HET9239573.1 hypothetical protein [Oligoflexus sp.]
MPLQFSEILKILEDSLFDIARFKNTRDGFSIRTQSKNKISLQYIRQSELSEVIEGVIRSNRNENFGVIVDSLSSNAKRKLEAENISYITQDGEICLYLEQKVIRVSNLKPAKSKKALFKSDTVSMLPAPTDFISPYGLEILDAIFRLPNNKISDTTPYAFCRKFNLNHARLFKMLTSIGEKDIIGFKSAVRKLPSEWWKDAFTYPRTNQRLLSFRKRAESYVSPLNADFGGTYQAVDEVRNKHGESAIIMGPNETLKSLGYITSDDLHFWVVTDDALKTIKRALKLTPAISGVKGVNVAIAKIRDEDELKRQSILSHVPDYGELNSETREINYFRAIWDSCNADSRLQSAAIDMLNERVLK